MHRTRSSRAAGLALAAAAGALAGAMLSRTLSTHAAPGEADPASAEDAQPSPPGGWLKGSTEEKLRQIERHLRGLDLSMAEIGYTWSPFPKRRYGCVRRPRHRSCPKASSRR